MPVEWPQPTEYPLHPTAVALAGAEDQYDRDLKRRNERLDEIAKRLGLVRDTTSLERSRLDLSEAYKGAALQQMLRPLDYEKQKRLEREEIATTPWRIGIAKKPIDRQEEAAKNFAEAMLKRNPNLLRRDLYTDQSKFQQAWDVVSREIPDDDELDLFGGISRGEGIKTQHPGFQKFMRKHPELIDDVLRTSAILGRTEKQTTGALAREGLKQHETTTRARERDVTRQTVAEIRTAPALFKTLVDLYNSSNRLKTRRETAPDVRLREIQGLLNTFNSLGKLGPELAPYIIPMFSNMLMGQLRAAQQGMASPNVNQAQQSMDVVAHTIGQLTGSVLRSIRSAGAGAAAEGGAREERRMNPNIREAGLSPADIAGFERRPIPPGSIMPAPPAAVPPPMAEIQVPNMAQSPAPRMSTAGGNNVLPSMAEPEAKPYSPPWWNEKEGHRNRLIKVIADVESQGYYTPHMIGTPNEPGGDRTATRDMENLVTSLASMESDAGKRGDTARVERIRGEREYWETEIRRSGMSQAEYEAAGNEPLPPIPPRVRGPFGDVSVVEQEGENPLITNLPGRLPPRVEPPAPAMQLPNMVSADVMDAEGIPRMAQATRTILPPASSQTLRTSPTTRDNAIGLALIAAARSRAAAKATDAQLKATYAAGRDRRAELNLESQQRSTRFTQSVQVRDRALREGLAAYTLAFEGGATKAEANKQAVDVFRKTFNEMLPGARIEKIPDFSKIYKKPKMSALEQAAEQAALAAAGAKKPVPPRPAAKAASGPAATIKKRLDLTREAMQF